MYRIPLNRVCCSIMGNWICASTLASYIINLLILITMLNESMNNMDVHPLEYIRSHHICNCEQCQGKINGLPLFMFLHGTWQCFWINLPLAYSRHAQPCCHPRLSYQIHRHNILKTLWFCFILWFHPPVDNQIFKFSH